jgi:hypothetical protein
MDQRSREQWFEAVLAEYSSLRTESLSSMQYQQSVLTLGLGALGVLLGFGITTDGEDAKLLMLLLVVPAFSAITYLLYAIEFMRMVRVGRYIDDLEQYVNDRLPEPALGWEGWLDGRGGGDGRPRIPFYYAVPGLLLLIAYGAILLGFTQVWGNTRPHRGDWLLARRGCPLIQCRNRPRKLAP